jgi:glycosyltransferase involved in cell wall biosynthesis
MKILYHHRTRGEEPESIHIVSIVSALRELGHDVRIVGSAPVEQSDSKATNPRTSHSKRTMPRWLLELVQIAYNLVAFGRLLSVAIVHRPDFIYERYALFNASGVFVAKLIRVPLILEVNTPYARAWAKYFGLRMQWIASGVERYVFKAANHLITVTAVQKAMIVELGVLPDKISVSHNAINPDDFVATDANAARAGKIPLGALVAGFVGTMNRWQGMPGFADVAAAVAEQRQDIYFLFVGDGEFREPLESALGERHLLSRCIFAGRVSHAEIPQFISAMDICMLLDSNAYGSPMKIFEYWCLKKAVIAPDVEPVREIMTHGVNGIIIPAGSATAMANAVLALANDAELRASLAAAGNDKVLREHTWADNAAAIISAYEASRSREA